MGRYPWAEFFLFEALSIIVFYPTHRHAYRVVILAAMVYTAAQIYLTPEISNPPAAANHLGTRIAIRFAFTTYVLWAEGPFPDHWRRVRDDVHAETDPAGLHNLPSNFPFTKKLWWMLDLACGLRMVGWVQEPRSRLPQHPPPSRQTFLWKTVSKLITDIALQDLTSLVFAQRTAFDPRVHHPDDGPETYLAAVPLLHRVPYVVGHCVKVAAGAGAIQYSFALLSVGLGGSSPTLWPDIWGRWVDAYTVRKLWGQTWHQLFRPMLSGLARFVSNKVLRIPRGTNLSAYIQLYIVFLLSGIIHFAGDYAFQKRMVYPSIKFFLLQAVVITIEDLIIYIAKRLLLLRGIKITPGKVGESWAEAMVRVTGYCWVMLWLCLTWPSWQDERSAAGLNITDRGPIARFVAGTWE